MTGPKGNSEFCFPRLAQCWNIIEVKGKQNSLFPAGPVIKYFVIPPNSKLEKLGRNRLLYAGWLTNLQRFQGSQPDHVRVESSCCWFLRELVSLVRPRELASFDLRHVTRFPPIGRRIWVGRYNNWVWILTQTKFWKQPATTVTIAINLKFKKTIVGKGIIIHAVSYWTIWINEFVWYR